MEIDGRVAVVTGAAVGIGQAVACSLAERGAKLVLVDVADCAQTLRMVPGAVEVRGDLTDDAQVERVVATALGRFGGIDILVNNAGGGRPSARYPEAAPERWSAVLDLNLRAPMLLAQLALPALSAGGGGVVVTVASSAGLGNGPYGWVEYGVAKAGLVRFTTAMGSRSGVRFTCVAPDWVRTARAEAEWAAMSAEERAASPVPIPLPVLTSAVLALIGDDTLAGHVVALS